MKREKNLIYIKQTGEKAVKRPREIIDIFTQALLMHYEETKCDILLPFKF